MTVKQRRHIEMEKMQREWERQRHSHGLTASHGGWSFNNGCKYICVCVCVCVCVIWTCENRITDCSSTSLTLTMFWFRGWTALILKSFGFIYFVCFVFVWSVWLLRIPRQISMALNMIISWGLISEKDWILHWYMLG